MGTAFNPMRVLWFTNTLMPDAAQEIGYPAPRGSGWWMTALLDRLKLRKDLDLAVVTAWPLGGSRTRQVVAGGVTYFVVPQPAARHWLGRLGLEAGWRPSSAQLSEFARIVQQWKPDVLHVHGTEMDYGLVKARGLVSTPMAVSLQGLMAPYLPKTYGELLPQEINGALRRFLLPRPYDQKKWRWFCSRLELEEEVVCSADLILGRTDFDRAWTIAYDPRAEYRHVDEMLRLEFRAGEPWRLSECRRHSIFCTTADAPLKGLHLLLEAVYRLRRRYSDVRVSVAGGGFFPQPASAYARLIRRRIERWDLGSAVTFHGYLDAEQLAVKMREAHCFAMPSYMENSSNALQEAMLSGMPCVAAYTGGTPSIIDNNRTGLLFPLGDAAMLASKIAQVFEDDNLAQGLGERARTDAVERHAPDRIEAQVIAAYEELARHGGPGGSADPRSAVASLA